MSCPDDLPKLGCCDDEVQNIIVKQLWTGVDVSNNSASDATKINVINSLLTGLITCLDGEDFSLVPDTRRKLFAYGDIIRFPGDFNAGVVNCSIVSSAVQGFAAANSHWSIRYDEGLTRWRIEIMKAQISVITGYSSYCLYTEHQYGAAAVVTDFCGTFAAAPVVIPIPATTTLTLAESDGARASTDFFVPGQAGAPACCNPFP